MANFFKSDDSFLRKLTLGAAGTNATIALLRDMGFDPIELERGSTGFKIWKKIKIKRVRVPDIICLKTGLRFESRGKTKPEISMSHSLNDPSRAWDASLRDDDFVSVVVFEQNAESPLELTQISPIHFVNVYEMRRAYSDDKVSFTQPKGIEEGSEIRVIWPCAIAKRQSNVTEVEPGKIILSPVEPFRRQFIRLSDGRRKIALLPQVNLGDAVAANQIVAAAVPIRTSIQCPSPVGELYFIIGEHRTPRACAAPSGDLLNGR